MKPEELSFSELLSDSQKQLPMTKEMLAKAKDAIRRLRHQPRWEEPIRLGIASKSAEDATYLIRAGILGMRAEEDDKGNVVWHEECPSAYEEILHRDLLLSTRCIGDCKAPDLELAAETANKLLQIFLTVNSGV